MTCPEIQAQIDTLNAQKSVKEAEITTQTAVVAVKLAAAQATYLEYVDENNDLTTLGNDLTLINANLSGYMMLFQMQGC